MGDDAKKIQSTWTSNLFLHMLCVGGRSRERAQLTGTFPAPPLVAAGEADAYAML